MKIIKRTTAVIAAAFGVLFLATGETDIQFGFGITLLVLAVQGWE